MSRTLATGVKPYRPLAWAPVMAWPSLTQLVTGLLTTGRYFGYVGPPFPNTPQGSEEETRQYTSVLMLLMGL